MSRESPAISDPNHIDYLLGTNFGTSFVLDNVIDGVIAFANGDAAPDPKHHVRLLDIGTLKADGHEVYLLRGGKEAFTSDHAEATKGFVTQVQQDRLKIAEILRVASEGLTSLAKYLHTYKTDDRGDLLGEVDIGLYPTLKFDPSGRPALGWRVSGPTYRVDWAKLAAVLIAENADGDSTEIGRCHLASCGRFFRIRRAGPGKPSRKYCPGTDHMKQAHELTSTDRSRRKRLRDAAELKKKRRRASAGKK